MARALIVVLALLAGCRRAGPTAEPRVKIGRTTSVAGLAETRAAGFDFAELGISKIAKMSEGELAAAIATHKAVGLPTPVANGFLPGELKVTGPNVNRDEQMAYVRKAFERLPRFGVKLVMFGSGNARNVPDGFSREEAWGQLVDFSKRIAAEAQARGLVVCVEPLQKKESNIVNTATEGLELVKAVGHPNFELMVDFYHLASDGEDPDVLLKAKDHIRHFHFANPKGRIFPLEASEYDYARFFANVRAIGFRGGLSVEAKPRNGIAADGPKTVAFLRASLP
jgi:D-psicose/D-tagatose/L-ribulose 3-epimerase